LWLRLKFNDEIKGKFNKEFFAENFSCRLNSKVVHFLRYGVCHGYMDLDYRLELLIFELILTLFEASIVFWCSWGSPENWLEPKAKSPLGNLACPNPWNALYIETTFAVWYSLFEFDTNFSLYLLSQDKWPLMKGSNFS